MWEVKNKENIPLKNFLYFFYYIVGRLNFMWGFTGV